MAKRSARFQRAIRSWPSSESTAALRRGLARRKKAELVEVLAELAETDRTFFRRLMARFDVMPSAEELVTATRQAIADATAFDKRDINRNFAYDHAAYAEVKRNFGQLIGSGQLRQALSLALELMKQGSYQVEMSDEGLMTGEIEECLGVVVEALGHRNDVPSADGLAWCTSMLASDRVGFIARESLESLRKHFQTAVR